MKIMSEKNKTRIIILFYLFLFASVIIPIDICGYFRTIRIIQDNIRPFIVVFITLSGTFYLKIYNDVENINKEDIKNFKADFIEAYFDLQDKIEKLENNKLEYKDLELQFIKTDLRYLMMEKTISKKYDFFSFYENYFLWKQPSKLHACDYFLQNGKNLLQDCFDEIMAKNPNDNGIILKYACLEDVKFRNIKIIMDYDHYDIHIDITGTDFFGADFSNSTIDFIGREDIRNGYDLGWFNTAIFNNSTLNFSCSIKREKKDSELIFKFPTISYIKTTNSKLKFDIGSNWHYALVKKKNRL